MEAHATLTTLDYVVLGTILLSGLLALLGGFVREMLSLGAWLGSTFAAAKLYPLAVPWVRRYIHNVSTATDIAVVVVFCISLALLSLIGNLTARLIKGQALTAIDRSLGFVFGLLRGGLIVCLLYLGVTLFLWPDIDKPPQPVAAQQQAEAETRETRGREARAREKQAAEEAPAPAWLMQAKTRPFLAYGAAMLKGFIPEGSVEKKMLEYFQQKKEAEKQIRTQERDILGIAAPAPSPDNKPPVYDDRSRSGLDALVNQKGTSP